MKWIKEGFRVRWMLQTFMTFAKTSFSILIKFKVRLFRREES
jgi:hypothetical protein